MRRATLKAVAIPGYQVPFASGNADCPRLAPADCS
ncbi:MAG: alpha-D-ribose 1-methylphosphonate 5-phosphate C-P-lyase PhnJ [Holdemania massiliensis]